MYRPASSENCAVNSHADHLDSHVLFIRIFYSQHSEVICFDTAIVLFHRFVFWFGFCLFFFFNSLCILLIGSFVSENLCLSYLLFWELSFFSSFVPSVFCVFFFTNLLLDGCWTSWIFFISSILCVFHLSFLFTRLDYVIFIFHSCFLQNFKVSSFNGREFFLVLW